MFEGAPLIKGKRVTGFTNEEEEEVQLTHIVPFLVEDELKSLGATFEKKPNWQVFTITDGIGMENQRYFEHFSRWLGKPPPRSLPAAVLKAGSWPVEKAAELRGGESDMNPATVDYMCRRGTYSIRKAREMLGYEPRVSFEEGMERMRSWLEDEGLLS